MAPESGGKQDQCGKALERVAGLGVWKGAEEQRSECDIGEAKAGPGNRSSSDKACNGGGDIKKVEDAESEREGDPGRIVIEFEPAVLGREHFGSGPQPHVGDLQHREHDVEAQRMSVNSLLGQRGEASIEVPIDALCLVIAFQQSQGLLSLFRSVERARWEVAGIRRDRQAYSSKFLRLR